MSLDFDELFRKKLQEVPHFVKKHEKWSIWPNLYNFSNKLPCLCISKNFSGKSYKKCLISWESSRNHRFRQHYATVRTDYHVFAFRWTFKEKVGKSGSLREKARKILDLMKTCNFSNKPPCFGVSMNFSAKVCKKRLNSWKSTRNHRFGQNFATFSTTTISLDFDHLLKKKLKKVPEFVEKHEKSSIWPNLYNFSNKLPCLWISMNFSEKSCKKCLISLKSTKNHRSGQIFITFRTNYPVFAFRWTFEEKVAKRAAFRDKARKTIDLAKTCNFLSKLPCLGLFMNFSERSWQKCLISWKSTRNHRFRQHCATFGTNYHVFAFRWTFKEKVGNSGSFHEKARKILDLVKSCNFSNKLPCFSVSMNLSAKGCKKWLNSWKSTKLIDLAKTLQLFEQTTMSFHFDQLYRKKLPHFVKRYEKQSIWLKLSFFRANYHVLPFSWTFQKEVAKSASFREKARKLIDLAKTMQLFLTNYHVLVFRWTFQQKVAKSGSFREKAREIIDVAKTLQLFEQTTMSLHFDQLFRKKLQKVPYFVKKHEKPSIWPKLAIFRANYHVLAFSWTFQKEVAKSASFREKAREIIDFANTMQLFEQTTMFLHFDEFLRKRLEKVVHFVKKHEKSWIWSKLATFRTNYHVLVFRWTFRQTVAETSSFREKARKLIDLAKTMELFLTNYHVLVFRWTFQQRVAKSGSIREKAREIIDLAKTLQLFEKLPCLCISMNFSGKSCKKCLISWKSTKNHRSGQNFATFRTHYHVFPFRWTFQKKVAKSASFREKTRKTIDLAKTCNFSNKLPCLGIFMNFSARSCKKCLIPWKKHEKSSISPKLAIFRTNHHVLAFSWTFQKEVAKSALFCERAREIIDLTKTCNFSKKLRSIFVSMNFMAKSCKNCLISWKSTKNHRFGQNFQLFEQTTMSLHFHELLSKKLQKVPHSVEKAREIIDFAKTMQLFRKN